MKNFLLISFLVLITMNLKAQTPEKNKLQNKITQLISQLTIKEEIDQML